MPREVGLTNVAPRVRVVAGILRNSQGQVLISDRPNAKTLNHYWEFPGGKLHNHEVPADALRRELREEIGVEADLLQHFCSLDHQYADQFVAIDFYLVKAWRGTPTGRENQKLKWVDPAMLEDDVLLPADAPVLAALRNEKN